MKKNWFRKGVEGGTMPLLAGAVIFLIIIAMFVFKIPQLLFKGESETDQKFCNIKGDYDQDKDPNQFDYCACDHKDKAMVFKVNANRNPELRPCLAYNYECDTSRDVNKCWPTVEVKGNTQDNKELASICGQRDGTVDQGIDLEKMDVKENGQPVEYCETDKATCTAIIEAECERTAKA